MLLAGIPTDEEQATGLEKIIMKAMKEGSVRSFICEQKRVTFYVCMYSKMRLEVNFCEVMSFGFTALSHMSRPELHSPQTCLSSIIYASAH